MNAPIKFAALPADRLVSVTIMVKLPDPVELTFSEPRSSSVPLPESVHPNSGDLVNVKITDSSRERGDGIGRIGRLRRSVDIRLT